MDTDLIYDILPQKIRSLLPDANFLSEIRIRANLPLSFTADGENIVKNVTVNEKELAEIVTGLCEGSLFAHEDTIRQGYISFHGCRIGVCGQTYENAKNTGIRNITSICIRIPHIVTGVCAPIAGKIAERNFRCGTLIYSPPGVGKTTLLRDIAITLSSPPYSRRVVIVDSRNEIFDMHAMKNCMIDALEGYGKAAGIEIATRTLSPQLIVCDEIGGYDECNAILSAQNTGVPLIASAHADSLQTLLSRPNIQLLYEHGIFDLLCGIRRNPKSRNFLFDIQERGKNLC